MYNNLTSAEVGVLVAENKILASDAKQALDGVKLKEAQFAIEIGAKEKSLKLKTPPTIFVPNNINKIVENIDNNPNYTNMLELQYAQAKANLEILRQNRYRS